MRPIWQRVGEFLGKTNNLRSPVVAVVAYMVARGSSPDPFFLDHERNALSKQCFIRELREALMAIGVNQSSFTGHSFRIGVATTASQAGLSDSTIQSLGR